MKRNIIIAASFGLMLVLAACSGNKTKAGLDPAKFDTTIQGKQVKLYTLKNANGMEADITNYGGRIVALCVPDKNGDFRDVELGYDNIAQYADTTGGGNNFGAIIGRYANRINKGVFTADGKKIQLPINNNGHCLHGGNDGWDKRVFDVAEANDTTLKLTLLSSDGDANFPGNVNVTVTYTLKSDNTLDLAMEATTDKETIINMTNHSYFNLSGDPSKPGTNMVLYINADNYTPTDSTLMTTGVIKSVYGTPMDFTKRHPLFQTIGDTSWEDIRIAGGYDQNWCLNTYKDGKGDDTRVAASLYSPDSGIFLELYTNEPGLQVYTGNFLGTDTRPAKHGIVYPRQASVSMEPQKYPDSPNKKSWPSPYVKPGEKYFSHVAYKFSVK